MMKLLLPALAVIAMLAGCAGESLEKKVLGKWNIDLAKTEMSGKKVEAEADKKFIDEILKTVSLELKEDKTFQMEFFLTLTGTWAVQGNNVILTPNVDKNTTISFAGDKKTMDFTVDSAATTMTFAAETPEMKGKLVLTKPAP